ncbi:MAG: hypothetical protein EPO28_02785 [Saprospiraceae bacterium]|nr:MAG: hypothetical protein EPO28_02785 [Saprospiraceae bacterium]
MKVDGYFEGGKTEITVARRMPNGKLILGFYLVDLWCLGVKDTFYRVDITIPEYQDLLGTMNSEVNMIACQPKEAFNMIYASIEFAENFGFKPHKDFKITSGLLDPPDQIEYMDIETGLDGKPCYYSGPDDNVEAILKKLDANPGRGNYTYMGIDTLSGFEDGDFASLEELFPPQKVEEYLHKVPQKYKMEFTMQVVIAKLTGKYLGGDFTSLGKEYDEELVLDITESYEAALQEIMKVEGLAQHEFDEVEQNANEVMVRLVINRIIKHGGVAYLFEKEYRPLPISFDPDEIKDMEQGSELEKEMMAAFPPEYVLKNLFTELAVHFINDHYDGNPPDIIDDASVRDMIITRVVYFFELSGKGLEPIFDSKEGMEEYCRKTCADIFNNFGKDYR